jgi:tetratricopeptide (TPR) repeat protein
LPDRQIEGCTSIISAARETRTNMAIAYNNRGNAYVDKKQYELALSDYDHALRLSPDYSVAFRNRGLAYNALKDYDRAISDYDEARQRLRGQRRLCPHRGGSRRRDQARSQQHQQLPLARLCQCLSRPLRGRRRRSRRRDPEGADRGLPGAVALSHAGARGQWNGGDRTDGGRRQDQAGRVALPGRKMFLGKRDVDAMVAAASSRRPEMRGAILRRRVEPAAQRQ